MNHCNYTNIYITTTLFINNTINVINICYSFSPREFYKTVSFKPKHL